MIEFPITDLDHESAETAVLEQQDRYPSGPYGRRSADRQRTGRLGEAAFASWLAGQTDLPVRSLYAARGAAKAADVVVGRMGVELKSARPASWEKFGPTVSAYQLRKIRASARVVAFIIVDTGPFPAVANFAGWLPTQQITALAHPEIVEDLRAQLSLRPEDLSIGEEFVDAVEADAIPPVRPLADSRCAACREWREFGICWACCPRPRNSPAHVAVTSSGRHFHGPDWASARAKHPDIRWFDEVNLTAVVGDRRPCLLCLPNLLPPRADASG